MSLSQKLAITDVDVKGKRVLIRVCAMNNYLGIELELLLVKL